MRSVIARDVFMECNHIGRPAEGGERKEERQMGERQREEGETEEGEGRRKESERRVVVVTNATCAWR